MASFKGSRGTLDRWIGGIARPSELAKPRDKIGNLRKGRGSQVVCPCLKGQSGLPGGQAGLGGVA